MSTWLEGLADLDFRPSTTGLKSSTKEVSAPSSPPGPLSMLERASLFVLTSPFGCLSCCDAAAGVSCIASAKLQRCMDIAMRGTVLYLGT